MNFEWQDGDFGDGDDGGDCAANAPSELDDVTIEAPADDGDGRRPRGPPPFIREARQSACEGVS